MTAQDKKSINQNNGVCSEFLGTPISLGSKDVTMKETLNMLLKDVKLFRNVRFF